MVSSVRYESDLFRDGVAIVNTIFDIGKLHELNTVASKLPPFVGLTEGGRWMNHTDVEQCVEDIDWAYHWARTPEDNTFINDIILPTLQGVADVVFDSTDWGWQTTNQYIMSNGQHDLAPAPHLDAPYLWPQMLDVQMAKDLPKGPLSLTFMVPLVDFTPDNGATAYVPGTHRHIYDTADWEELKPHLRTFFNDNYIQPSVPLGSFACLYGNCLHSVMANKTDTVRRGIIYRAIRQDALDEMTRLGLG